VLVRVDGKAPTDAAPSLVTLDLPEVVVAIGVAHAETPPVKPELPA